MIKTAILTISDKGYKKERVDLTGPAISNILPKNNYTIEYYKILPDEKDIIKSELLYLCDELNINLILTNGGTGFSKRDVTPEATLEVIERICPGFPETMRAASLKITPHAMLSRAVSGIKNSTLIINLPGSPKGATENLEAILCAIPHGVKILTGEESECAR